MEERNLKEEDRKLFRFLQEERSAQLKERSDKNDVCPVFRL